jgi:lipoprotein-anchoring transpeptidase ErfK/SrfK
MVMSTPVSTGTRKTPTPRGTFRIYRKYAKQRMRGPGYDLPNVPWVMYFRRGGYAIHGTYWHSNFGQPMSHGCVNMPIGEAAWLYQWASNGTVVVVQ